MGRSEPALTAAAEASARLRFMGKCFLPRGQGNQGGVHPAGSGHDRGQNTKKGHKWVIRREELRCYSGHKEEGSWGPKAQRPWVER